MAAHQDSATADTPIHIKVAVNDSIKKLKLPLRDLGATVLPDKLRQLLAITPEQSVVFERFSDSAGGYITLDPSKPQVFKTLVRAAKAKLKLRLKATVSPDPNAPVEDEAEMPETTPSKTVEPVIVRSPVYQNGQRESTAFDRRSLGSGIFQFREARASQNTLVDTEAPVPLSFVDSNNDFFAQLASHGTRRELALRSREPVVGGCTNAWSVYCNECDVVMADAHFHCSICDGGNYDLCERCVRSGKLCPGEGHWLIKRFIKNGKVINSTTERVGRKNQTEKTEEVEKEVPGAFTEDIKTLTEEPRIPTRTCNSCVVVLAEQRFVTCTSCEDFDLCISCHLSNKHGHHPGHGFKPAINDTALPFAAETMLAPGRNVRHNAICDGCDKKIYGIRHKCLNCPDWDYCNDCIKNARQTHPRHRFAAIYSPIADAYPNAVRHFGIYCDGPLCNNKGVQSYIMGVRYKCAVCHDTDFCGSCEAIPGNHHNRTHPLIKFKTPVRNVSITTMNEDVSGNVRRMGDSRPETPETKSTATETTPVQSANAATQVQTMADFKPTEEKSEIETEVARPIPVIKPEEKTEASPTPMIPATLLNAHFVQDSIQDGMVIEPSARFTQIWTLRNPGPYAWPTGCSVRYVGGDNMLNVDNARPASITDIADATESNVVGREVAVGEQVAFKVVLKAPVREGKAISYWRLKAADGTPFGHRLWCDVEVQKVEEKVESEHIEFKPAAQLMTAAPSPLAQGYQPIPSYASSRAEALRQHQQRMMQHQQMVQQAQSQAALAQTALQGNPPAYSAAPFQNMHNQARARANMAMENAQRRQHMLSQFQAQRDQLQAAGIKREDMPSWQQHCNATLGSQSQSQQAALQQPQQAFRDFLEADVEKGRNQGASMQRAESIKCKILDTREAKARGVKEGRERVLQQAKESESCRREAEAVATEKLQAQEEAEKCRKDKADRYAENVKKIIEAANANENLEGSKMIFPTLEKESPASSTYQSVTSSRGKAKAAYVEDEEGKVERSALPSVASTCGSSPASVTIEPVSPATEKDEEQFEDLTDEIDVLSADEESNDGFLTDEEYDILDASDQETVGSQ